MLPRGGSGRGECVRECHDTLTCIRVSEHAKTTYLQDLNAALPAKVDDGAPHAHKHFRIDLHHKHGQFIQHGAYFARIGLEDGVE